jgi:hypothetical protein
MAHAEPRERQSKKTKLEFIYYTVAEQITAKGGRLMTLTLCPFKCPQSSTCARYNEKNDKSKVHFLNSPRNEIGCPEYKRKKEKKYERK